MRLMDKFLHQPSSLRIAQGVKEAEHFLHQLASRKRALSCANWIFMRDESHGPMHLGVAGCCWCQATKMSTATTGWGTVRRLLEEDLLPQHICGTSVPWQLPCLSAWPRIQSDFPRPSVFLWCFVTQKSQNIHTTRFWLQNVVALGI